MADLRVGQWVVSKADGSVVKSVELKVAGMDVRWAAVWAGN